MSTRASVSLLPGVPGGILHRCSIPAHWERRRAPFPAAKHVQLDLKGVLWENFSFFPPVFPLELVWDDGNCAAAVPTSHHWERGSGTAGLGPCSRQGRQTLTWNLAWEVLGSRKQPKLPNPARDFS